MSGPDDTQDSTQDDDMDLRAAEYVMGALPMVEAKALEALALHDPALAARIAAWETRLAPLSDALPEMPPPDALWRRLALATGIESSIRPVPLVRASVPPRSGPSRRVGIWQASTAAALALAASLGFLLLNRPATTPGAGPEAVMAALSPIGAPGATFLVRVGADGTATIVAVGAVTVPSGRSLELWAVAEGTSVPVSLGLLPASGRVELSIRNAVGTKLLVSQEPAGGSPTKQPTGPVVHAGVLTGV